MSSHPLLSAACLLASLSLLLPSCTVKEDRSLCKAYAEIAFSGDVQSRFSGRSARIALFDGDLQDAAVSVDSKWHPFRVARTDVLLSAWITDGLSAGTISEDGTYLLRDGQPCDSLWAGVRSFSAEGSETLREEASLHKRFVTLTVSFDEDAFVGWSYTLSYDVAGTAMRTLGSIPGKHTEELLRDTSGKARTRLPWCGDDAGIELLLTPPASLAAEPFTIDVQANLKSAGLDWGKEDLDDATIGLGSVLVEFAVEPGEWEDGGSLSSNIDE